MLDDTKKLTVFYLIEFSLKKVQKLFPRITIIYANILIISSIFRREGEKITFNFTSTSHIYFSYIKPHRVLCFAVRGHSVFVQPFVKLPRCLLSYFDISVRLVHVWIQSSPAISCLLNSGQLHNLDKDPRVIEISNFFAKLCKLKPKKIKM